MQMAVCGSRGKIAVCVLMLGGSETRESKGERRNKNARRKEKRKKEGKELTIKMQETYTVDGTTRRDAGLNVCLQQ